MLQLISEPQPHFKILNIIRMEQRIVRTLRASPYQPRAETQSTTLIPQPYFFSLIIFTSFSSFLPGGNSLVGFAGLFSASMFCCELTELRVPGGREESNPPWVT